MKTFKQHILEKLKISSKRTTHTLFPETLEELFGMITDEIYKQYDYILDDSLSPEQIFVKYVNQQKGFEYINVDDLMEILNDL